MAKPDNRTNEELNRQGPRLVTVKEFLKLVPLSREFAYRAFKSGQLPCLKAGRRILVDVDECLEAMRMKSQE